jgi:hypothetical protein
MGYAKFIWTPPGGSETSYTLAANYSFPSKAFLQDESDRGRAIDGTLRSYGKALKESWLLAFKNISLAQRDQLKTIKEAQVDLAFYKETNLTGVIDTLTLANAGTDFIAGNVLLLNQARAQGATIRIDTVHAVTGAIVTWTLTAPGSGYRVANGIPTSVYPSGYSAATFNITALEASVSDVLTFNAQWVNDFNFVEVAPGIWAGTIQLEEV